MKDIILFGVGVAIGYGYLYYKDNPSMLSKLQGAVNSSNPTLTPVTTTPATSLVSSQAANANNQPFALVDNSTASGNNVPVTTAGNNMMTVEKFYKASGTEDSFAGYIDPNVIKRPIAVATVNSIYSTPAYLTDFTPLTTNN